MGEVKPKTFEKFVTVLNIIAIIFMIVIIAKVGIVEKCTNNSNTRIQGMELHQFNSRFTTYEGIMTGSQIKQLVETVNASNIGNDGKELVVSINGRTNENQYIFKGGISKKYKVEIEYDNNLVSNINIYKIITKNETNDVSVNYTEFAEITGFKEQGSIGKVENIKRENKVRYEINWYILLPSIIILILYFAIYISSKSIKKRILKECNEEECQKKLDKITTNTATANLIISILAIVASSIIINNIISVKIDDNTKYITADKPIIYIYPEEETEVTVELGRKENLTCTYPIYEDKWKVIAKSDGTLIDDKTGRTYYALYWEGINSKKYGNKLENGFVVKGEDTIKFLEEKLAILGLNERETEEFIVYWLPKMQNNRYNYIRFQTMEEIDKNMPLEITPEPETLIRVMMEWKELNKYIEVEEQQLEKVERKGYTVVEWGGTEIK